MTAYLNMGLMILLKSNQIVFLSGKGFNPSKSKFSV